MESSQTPQSPAASTLPHAYGPPISLMQAQACGNAAVARAIEIGVPITVAICDAAGTLVFLARMDAAIAAGAQVAEMKARCAAMYKRPTKAFEVAVASSPGGVRFLSLGGVVAVEGGAPILISDSIAGAIGVSGGTGAEDGAIAEAGLSALHEINLTR